MAIAVPTAPDIERTDATPAAPLVFRVNVTERDIRDGVRESAYFCPLALAILALGFDYASIGEAEAYWHRRGNRDVSARPLPETADFVRRFDSGEPVEPGQYGFEVPG